MQLTPSCVSHKITRKGAHCQASSEGISVDLAHDCPMGAHLAEEKIKKERTTPKGKADHLLIYS